MEGLNFQQEGQSPIAFAMSAFQCFRNPAVCSELAGNALINLPPKDGTV
jgi:hypothetical protein